MKQERIVSILPFGITAERIAAVVAENIGAGKKLRAWKEQGGQDGIPINGPQYSISMASSDGIYAMRIADRKTGDNESIAIKDDIIVMEAHTRSRRLWLPSEHSLAFRILRKECLIPGAESIFRFKDARPTVLDEDLAFQMVPYINGAKDTAMPIVLLSLSKASGKPLVDAGKLQSDLRGIAHVMYPETEEVASYIRDATKDKNGRSRMPYNGAALLIVSGKNRRIFSLNTFCDPEAAVPAMLAELRSRVNTDERYRHMSYDRVLAKAVSAENRELKSEKAQMTDAIEELRSRIKTTDDEELERLFDRLTDELEDAKKRRAEAEAEAARWKSLAQGANKEDGLRAITIHTDEEDLYPSEIRDAVLFVLRNHLESLRAGEPEIEKDRIGAVLASIMRSNKAEGAGDELFNGIKNTLIAERSLSESDISKLRKLGLVEKPGSDGKHYKFLLNGDERYGISLSVTPSDRYSRRNEVQRIKNLLFPR